MEAGDTRHLTLRMESTRNRDALPAGSWTFAPGDSPRVGRASECEVVIRHPRISRIHGTFVHEQGGWHYASFGTNGSFVNDASVDHVPVRDGLEIELGNSSIRVNCALQSPDALVEGSSYDASESRGSITDFLSGFAAGDEECTRELWARCFATVVRLARHNLGGVPKRVADEEDVAASVFASLFFGAVEGKFPDLTDSDSLWRLIVVMTRRKAADYVNHERRDKRGGGKVRGDSIFPQKPGSKPSPGFDHFVSEQPSPMAVAMVEENTSELLEHLPDEEHRQIAMLRLEGFSTAETADELGLSLRTVERRLQTIRTIWTQLLQLAGVDDDDPSADD